MKNIYGGFECVHTCIFLKLTGSIVLNKFLSFITNNFPSTQLLYSTKNKINTVPHINVKNLTKERKS